MDKKTEFIERYQALYRKYGYINSKDARRFGFHSSTIKKLFGSWNELLELAGVPVKRRSPSKRIERVCECGCGRTFETTEINERRFFSISCSNRARSGKPYNPKNEFADICPTCQGKKARDAIMCQGCRTKKNEAAALNSPISKYFLSGNARIKYSPIRKWAKIVMDRYGPDKECGICGFDVVVDVCHIKPISDFPDTALLGEVNDIDNLIYLCPNHHAMLDRGLLDL